MLPTTCRRPPLPQLVLSPAQQNCIDLILVTNPTSMQDVDINWNTVLDLDHAPVSVSITLEQGQTSPLCLSSIQPPGSMPLLSSAPLPPKPSFKTCSVAMWANLLEQEAPLLWKHMQHSHSPVTAPSDTVARLGIVKQWVLPAAMHTKASK